MKTAAGDFNLALQTLRHLGLLLETDARLPSVASLIAGEPVSGSWWAHARSHEIFAALGQFDDHRDVTFTKLISGKVTLVHRKLWPELFAIGTARAPWQVQGLSRSAVTLLEMIDKQESLRTDAVAWAKSAAAKAGEAARELEKKLLVHAGQIHTETGAHAKLLETWEAWAKRIKFKAAMMPAVDAQRKIEERVRKLNDQFGARARLPWA